MISSFFDKDTALVFNPPLQGEKGLELLNLLFYGEDRKKYNAEYNVIEYSLTRGSGIAYIRIYGKNITKYTIFSDDDNVDIMERLTWFRENNYRVLDGYSVIPDSSQAIDKLYEQEDDFEWAKEIVNQNKENPKVKINGKPFTMNQEGCLTWKNQKKIIGWTSSYPIIGMKNHDGLECYIIKLDNRYTVFIPVSEFEKDNLSEARRSSTECKIVRPRVEDLLLDKDFLFGKAWHMDLGHQSQSVEAQEWLFKLGFEWPNTEERHVIFSDRANFQSVWPDNRRNRTFTGSSDGREWTIKDSQRVASEYGSKEIYHFNFSDIINSLPNTDDVFTKLYETEIEDPKRLLGLEFVLSRELETGNYTVYTITSMSEMKGVEMFEISWVKPRTGITTGTRYPVKSVIRLLERGDWVPYTGNFFNKLND